jgi:hypothetical protein
MPCKDYDDVTAKLETATAATRQARDGHLGQRGQHSQRANTNHDFEYFCVQLGTRRAQVSQLFTRESDDCEIRGKRGGRGMGECARTRRGRLLE